MSVKYSSMSIVNWFTNSFQHAWCECFQEPGGNVAPCSEDGFRKDICSEQLTSFFCCTVFWSPCPVSCNHEPLTDGAITNMNANITLSLVTMLVTITISSLCCPNNTSGLHTYHILQRINPQKGDATRLHEVNAPTSSHDYY